MDCTGITIERCNIHDPRDRANPWFFSHPSGPQAIFIGRCHQTVIRWNDFIGSNQHRWNDGIEGWGNFAYTGGFAQDADIYGNVIAFGNDDGIELDGGQNNVRLFGNWIEGFYCGVSTVPCLRGPSYIFNNLITRLGDEIGASSHAFKSGGGTGLLHIFNNTCITNSGLASINTNSPLHAVSRNNIFEVRREAIRERTPQPGNSFDYDLCYGYGYFNGKIVHPDKLFNGSSFGSNMILDKPIFTARDNGNYQLHQDSPGKAAAVAIPNFAETGQDTGCSPKSANFPERPGLKFQINAIRIDLSPNFEPANITITATEDTSFKIIKNEAFNWFTVEPQAGNLKQGNTNSLSTQTLKFNWNGSL